MSTAQQWLSILLALFTLPIDRPQDVQHKLSTDVRYQIRYRFSPRKKHFSKYIQIQCSWYSTLKKALLLETVSFRRNPIHPRSYIELDTYVICIQYIHHQLSNRQDNSGWLPDSSAHGRFSAWTFQRDRFSARPFQRGLPILYILMSSLTNFVLR
jgi:hypothetical protein